MLTPTSVHNNPLQICLIPDQESLNGTGPEPPDEAKLHKDPHPHPCDGRLLPDKHRVSFSIPHVQAA